MWELYDELIENIPGNICAKDVRIGSSWGYVSCENNCGIGVMYPIDSRMPRFKTDWTGKPLKDIACCAKSWNLIEASVGIAAINCYYNSMEQAIQNGIHIPTARSGEDRMNDPFISYQKRVRNKNVAVVGHFPYLETLIEPICNLSILELDPQKGDYPISAGEYLIPEADYVFLTCGTLTDKRLPRLLELSKNAWTVLVGPATPLTPLLFSHGVDDMSGFVFRDMDKADRILTGGQFGSMYTTGYKVYLSRLDKSD
ncbi:MAG: DUF364 domain-containing protein [Clostridiales bacterium]|nr:DUF364 domain-containing protein [Clostridiales bacterium]